VIDDTSPIRDLDQHRPGMKMVQTKHRKETRNQQGQLLTLLNGWDPAGLLNAGAPRNEYDFIVDELLGLLSRNTSQADVTAFLEREVIEHFGTPAPDAARFAAKVIAWFRMLPPDTQ
jgi:hypothetical protein